MRDLRQALRLVLVTDRSAARMPLCEMVDAALRGGATGVMLREKDLPSREIYELAMRLRVSTRRVGALFIVNDRVDIALAVAADGVHLGWRSLPIDVVRRIVGRESRIGVSVHSPGEARDAERNGADYVVFGPVFPTPSKKGLVEVQGIEGLEEARRMTKIPLVAIGGIEPANAADAIGVGADGIAVIRSLAAAQDPEEAARRLLAARDCRRPEGDL